MLGWYDVKKTGTGIMFLLFMNCFGQTDGLFLGGMMWKKAAVDISDALIHITSPSFVRRLMALMLKIIIGGEDVNINLNTSINTNMMLMLMLMLVLMLMLMLMTISSNTRSYTLRSLPLSFL